MKTPIERISNKQVKNWYNNNLNLEYFNKKVEEFEEQGYRLSQESGLLFRFAPKKIIENSGQTFVYIVYFRPSEFHLHPNINETIFVIGGKGKLFYAENSYEPRNITNLAPVEKTKRNFNKEESEWSFIREGILHGFRPDEGHYLELGIAYSKVYDPKKVISIYNFHDFSKQSF
ncbi:MAG: hypothetical protein ACOYT4_00215 [Nanoarchaeota archaeon]